jgi:hypothetical protein
MQKLLYKKWTFKTNVLRMFVGICAFTQAFISHFFPSMQIKIVA